MDSVTLAIIGPSTKIADALTRLEITNSGGALYRDRSQYRLFNSQSLIEAASGGEARSPLSSLSESVLVPLISSEDIQRFKLPSIGIGIGSRILPPQYDDYFEMREGVLFIRIAAAGAALVVSRYESALDQYASPPNYCRCDFPKVEDRCFYRVARHPKRCRHGLVVSCMSVR